MREEYFLKSDGFEGDFASKLVPKSMFRLPYVIEAEKATYEESYFKIRMIRYGTTESCRKIDMKIKNVGDSENTDLPPLSFLRLNGGSRIGYVELFWL